MNQLDRKKFIRLAAMATAAVSVAGCRGDANVPGGIIGTSALVGHLLRGNLPATEPVPSGMHDVLIIGAGVSGLSAARSLYDRGSRDFRVMDLEPHPGGNAHAGENAVSPFPWGAHYIPIPNNDLPEYQEFLRSCGVISGWNAEGLPIYNELHLCHDPEERLFLNGAWQTGLVPHRGLSEVDQAEIKRFFKMMDDYRFAMGNDLRQAFAIPVDQSSRDPVYRQMDKITMKQWLTEHDFTSAYLHDFVNYCTRDDFGTTHDRCSAWAGIHYFAGRKGKGSNAHYADVLTWPEGNKYLVAGLLRDLTPMLRLSCLVTSVNYSAEGNCMVHYYNVALQRMESLVARQVIMAIPQFVAARLLSDKQRQETVKAHLHYSPWMVANVQTDPLTERNGAPPSWDNVIHGSRSLGYVDATHQLLQQFISRRNLTYYQPLTDEAPATEREKAHKKSHGEWTEEILNELHVIHPDIRQKVRQIDVKVWGHAMAQPLPGFLFGEERKQLSSSVGGRIHFAHTDLAGISIFEEAFYQGLRAAETVSSLLMKEAYG